MKKCKECGTHYSEGKGRCGMCRRCYENSITTDLQDDIDYFERMAEVNDR